MAEIPLPGTSPEYDKVEKVVHTLIFDVALDWAANYILAAIPWLGWPVIKQVFMFTLTKLTTILYAAFERATALALIDGKVMAEKDAYIKATAELKYELAKPLEEQHAVTLAARKLEFKNRLRDLIRIAPH